VRVYGIRFAVASLKFVVDVDDAYASWRVGPARFHVACDSNALPHQIKRLDSTSILDEKFLLLHRKVIERESSTNTFTLTYVFLLVPDSCSPISLSDSKSRDRSWSRTHFHLFLTQISGLQFPFQHKCSIG